MKVRPNPRRRFASLGSARAGFSLLEMVIVLGIIAMIMGGAIYMLVGIKDDTKPVQAKADINAYLAALELYKMNNKNKYPSTAEGLNALKAKNKKNKIVQDPWGRDYIYRFPGKIDSSTPEIISLGADGQEGTDDDINSQNM